MSDEEFTCEDGPYISPLCFHKSFATKELMTRHVQNYHLRQPDPHIQELMDKLGVSRTFETGDETSESYEYTETLELGQNISLDSACPPEDADISTVQDSSEIVEDELVQSFHPRQPDPHIQELVDKLPQQPPFEKGVGTLEEDSAHKGFLSQQNVSRYLGFRDVSLTLAFVIPVVNGSALSFSVSATRKADEWIFSFNISAVYSRNGLAAETGVSIIYDPQTSCKSMRLLGRSYLCYSEEMELLLGCKLRCQISTTLAEISQPL